MRVTHVPVYGLAFIWGVSPRVEEPGINLIRSYAYSAPHEDLMLKRPGGETSSSAAPGPGGGHCSGNRLT